MDRKINQEKYSNRVPYEHPLGCLRVYYFGDSIMALCRDNTVVMSNFLKSVTGSSTQWVMVVGGIKLGPSCHQTLCDVWPIEIITDVDLSQLLLRFPMHSSNYVWRE
jgi:hypothetical protein